MVASTLRLVRSTSLVTASLTSPYTFHTLFLFTFLAVNLLCSTRRVPREANPVEERTRRGRTLLLKGYTLRSSARRSALSQAVLLWHSLKRKSSFGGLDAHPQCSLSASILVHPIVLTGRSCGCCLQSSTGNGTTGVCCLAVASHCRALACVPAAPASDCHMYSVCGMVGMRVCRLMSPKAATSTTYHNLARPAPVAHRPSTGSSGTHRRCLCSVIPLWRLLAGRGAGGSALGVPECGERHTHSACGEAGSRRAQTPN